ncbi:preprotein translocase subunit SecY [Candidatus Woesearchaeota archaeon]|nr:preprotein translocase subunit SecY [Candidatus Woesearchaeota archaeon]
MSFLDTLLSNLPEVKGPMQKRLSFKEKLKWTLIILLLFFIMSLVPLFGLGENALLQFEFLSIILGASFGSILSLGIGPIVTASIVLQLLNGAGILKMNLTSPDGRKRFQGLQKLLSIFFIIFEAGIYVFMGGLAPNPALAGTSLFFQMELLLVFQLFLGGMLILFMDEVVSKWGFGSGLSLFIAAGVSQQIFLRALNPLPSPTNPEIASGAIPALFQALTGGDPITAGLQIAALVSTILVFLIVVYTQSMKVEIPLSFGRIRGHGIRWPLNFFYTSNIPVILVAALLANIQLWARLVERWVGHATFLGGFTGNTATSGLAAWVNSPDIVGLLIKGGLRLVDVGHSLVYMIIMILGAIIFSIFWMQTANMDARSQADQIMSSGLQIPGFRRDPRVLESILKRYIWPLTVMGGAAVGFLAAFADLTGALSRGTGILLAVMIVYRLYEDIAKQHMMDMHPLMRKFME